MHCLMFVLTLQSCCFLQCFMIDRPPRSLTREYYQSDLKALDTNFLQEQMLSIWASSAFISIVMAVLSVLSQK